jgi:asparagine synthase (glutamine-hydrolysing)
MSGITGICNVDGRPADRALLQRLTQAMAHRGPDGIGHWVAGPVALGHAMLHTTPESLRETQPMSMQAAEQGGLCLTLDGRVDNRSELRAALASKGCTPRADTDAELVLRAYECWGEDCASHIIGDFAFAVWDERNRKLFCARDPLGIRPFYYHFDGRAFAFSSDLRPLLEMPGYRRRPNPGMLGEYLSDSITSNDETLFQDIRRLPPAHRLVLKDGSLSISRYFDFDPGKFIRYGSDEEYAEHFFEIFREAVSCRLRSHAPVALWLSGGLDSCSILGMAGQLEKEGVITNRQLASYTLACSHPDGDERAYVSEAAAMWGFDAHSLDVEDVAVESMVDSIRRHQDFPDPSPWDELNVLAEINGSRVNLVGDGGDEWLAGDMAHCADLLRQLRIPTLIWQFRHDVAQDRAWDWTGRAGRPPFSQFMQWCIHPLIPSPLKSAARRILRRNAAPSWIPPDFARAVGLQDRLRRPKTPPRFPTIAQQRTHALLDDGNIVMGREMADRGNAYQRMEGRQPFHDRRLIEFALALPENQRWRGDQTKYVLRHALRKHLPDSIRRRRTKADFSFLASESVARESAGNGFRALRLAEAGYVDAVEVRGMYDGWLQGKMSHTWNLWMILALERWLDTAILASAHTHR